MFRLLSWIISSRSGKWPTFRKIFLVSNPTCIACDSKKDLQVHHEIPVSVDPSKELEESNCMTLCSGCHLVFGHLHSFRSWNVNVREDCENHLKKVRSRPCHKV